MNHSNQHVSRVASVLLMLICLGLPSLAGAQIPFGLFDNSNTPSLAPMLDKVKPSIVNIATRSTVTVNNPLLEDPFFRRFFQVPQSQQKRSVQSAGSGVIVDADKGYIITNNHVVDKADEIQITLIDGRTFEAKLIGADPETDVAVIQIDADELTQISVGNSDKLRQGDFVVAIGNPFGLEHTVTSGIVSALNRSGLGIEKYENFIQTDASINPGNSGGALVNLNGELIGINTAILGRSGNIGIGFAIPSNMADMVMDQLIEHGHVKRGQLGVLIQDLIPELAKEFDTKPYNGVLISQVQPDSAAQEAGIQAGDIIVEANGKSIRRTPDLINVIGALSVGEKVELNIIRDGKSLRIDAKVGETATDKISASKVSRHLRGATLKDLDEKDSKTAKEGIMVTEVEPGSPAQQAGLKQGDIILAINRQPVNNLKELRELDIDDDGRLLLLVNRKGGAFWIVIQ